MARYSEFYTLTAANLTGGVGTPLDLSGACEVAICVMNYNCFVSRHGTWSAAANESFLLQSQTPGVGDGQPPFVFHSSDERLHLYGQGGDAIVYVWVTREVDA